MTTTIARSHGQQCFVCNDQCDSLGKKQSDCQVGRCALYLPNLDERVAGYTDRSGIQQSLDLGADGILIPYINTRKEAEEVSLLIQCEDNSRTLNSFSF
jgi:hypothetical protein